MSSIIKVDTIQDQDGNNIINESGDTITIGASGDTITIPSGATLDTSNSTVTLPDGSIGLAKLSATGTKDATTFLRGDNTFASAQGKFESELLHVRDEKSSSTSGGTFTQGAWRTRDLNTVVTNEITGASLSSNQITLPSGTYYIDASAPAYRMVRHMARLVNVTDSASAVNGSSEYGGSSELVQTRSFITGRFTIASEKDFEIQHYGEDSTTTFGFGVESNQITSIYTDVRIWRIA